MTLPRFTSGQMGRLSFSDLNEAFDLIEGGAAVPSSRLIRPLPSTVFLAKITGRQGEDELELGSWEEVSRENLTSDVMVKVDGGMTSSDGDNAFAIPLIAPVPSVGTVIAMMAHTAKNGRPYCVQFREKADTIMAKIVGVELISTNPNKKVWRYFMNEVKWTDLQSGSGYWGITSGEEIIGYNGCENVEDKSPGPRDIGVGSRHTAYSAERQAIKLETVVQAVRSMYGPEYNFSIPNGYSFACYYGSAP